MNTRFIRDHAPPRTRTIGLSVGAVGTGKTDFWLQGPAPVYVQSLDYGLEGVLQNIQRRYPGKDIRVCHYDWNMAHTDGRDEQEYAKEVLGTFEEDYRHALTAARTILWDKETDLWEVQRFAEFGGPSARAREYGPLFARVAGLINAAKETDVNLGIIQSLKDEWRDDKSTGRKVPRGCNRLEEWVFTTMSHRRDHGHFYLDIDKCRQNTALQDQTFGPLTPGELGLTFAEFGQLVIDGSDAEAWQ